MSWSRGPGHGNDNDKETHHADHRSLTTVLLVSVLMLATAGPANAFFDIGGAIQRAQMIVNQATQIANQIRQMRTMTRQLTELEEQLDYMKEAARGEVDGL